MEQQIKEWRSRGYIPHRDKIHLLQSITFRLADSLPQNILLELEEELLKLPREEQDLEKRKKIEHWLDSGIGCCALKHNAELGLGVPGKSFWMREYWDRFIRNEKHFNNVIEYIHNNPVKANLVTKKEDWKWSSAYYLK